MAVDRALEAIAAVPGSVVVVSLGEHARAWLRGAEGRSFDPLPAAGFTPGGSVV